MSRGGKDAAPFLSVAGFPAAPGLPGIQKPADYAFIRLRTKVFSTRRMEANRAIRAMISPQRT